MRINRFLAQAIGVSRRAADKLADEGQIMVNGRVVRAGHEVEVGDKVTYHGKLLNLPKKTTIIINKPVGYVVSRDGQGSKTVYDLLPRELHNLKPVGRLDKNSSGLLLLTNDGDLAHQLTHPKFIKEKVYKIVIDKSLQASDKKLIERGVKLEDGISKLELKGTEKEWIVTMHEGRNRQIRRTFLALRYTVTELHRTNFGDYKLGNLMPGEYQFLDTKQR